jgi:hypothetical protein
MKSKEELKKLFENGDKPTQEEFWEWQDSYWHKDEKLPIETAGLYKIKGSVPDKTALDTMTSMEEGDVYNLLDTGDNYVYVLNLNNTGSAGWDKLSGMIDLSTINLQRTLENGNIASDGLNQIKLSMFTESKFSYQTPDYLTNNVLRIGEDEAYLSKLSNGLATKVSLQEGGLKYNADYSDRADFGDRSLVDKAYVDSKVSPANFQTVIENGGTALNANSRYTFNLADENQNAYINFRQLSTDNQYSTAFTQSMDSIGDPNNASASIQFDVTTPDVSVGVRLGINALYYIGDYSAYFSDYSLVDKRYVDNKVSATTLQTVLENDGTASNDNSNYSFSLDDGNQNSSIQFTQQSTDGTYSTLFNQAVQDGGEPNPSARIDFKAVNAGKSFAIRLHDHALEYENDYSEDYTDRSLVDKGYVDSKTSPATLKDVIENGNTYTEESTNSSISFDVPNKSFRVNLKDSSTLEYEGSFYVGRFGFNLSSFRANDIFTGMGGTLSLQSLPESKNSLMIDHTATDGSQSIIRFDSNNALTYGDNYSSKFTDRSLVDKAYVDNAIEGITFEGLELTTNDSYPIVVIDPATGKLYYRML